MSCRPKKHHSTTMLGQGGGVTHKTTKILLQIEKTSAEDRKSYKFVSGNRQIAFVFSVVRCWAELLPDRVDFCEKGTPCNCSLLLLQRSLALKNLSNEIWSQPFLGDCLSL